MDVSVVVVVGSNMVGSNNMRGEKQRYRLYKRR